MNGADLDADTMFGGEGFDQFYLGPNDAAFGNEDNDLFLSSRGAPDLIDGGSGIDILRLNGQDIAGATLVSLERLVASDFSGGRLTAEQLGSFAEIAPLGDRNTVDLQLSGGGVATIHPAASLATLKIQGSPRTRR